MLRKLHVVYGHLLRLNRPYGRSGGRLRAAARISGLVCGAVALTTLSAPPADAQIDYRNLDEGRPVATEDAYPVERYAFELVASYEYENERGSGHGHIVAAELAYGIGRDMMIGVTLPFAAMDPGTAAEMQWGFGGPRIFAFYNFNTESPTLPALALRGDVALPVGSFAGDNARLGVTAIATRSWGRTRTHLNATVGLGSGADGEASALHGIPVWAASVALDRTFLRRSLMLIGDVGVRRGTSGAPTEITAALGARAQFTPTLVTDAGLTRRITDRAGPDLAVGFGVTHAFALAGLMPGGTR